MSARIEGTQLDQATTTARTILQHKFPAADHFVIEDAVNEAELHWLLEAPDEVLFDKHKCRAWILNCAEHAVKNFLRREKKEDEIDSQSRYDGKCEYDSTGCLEDRMELDGYLGELSKHSLTQQVAVVYHDLFGYSMDVVASVLGCSVNAAYMHHKRAMQNLHLIATGHHLAPQGRNSGAKHWRG